MMKITEKQLTEYIQQYIDHKGDSVMKRKWDMMLIHRLQYDKLYNNIPCSKLWITHIEKHIENLKKLKDFDLLYQKIKLMADQFDGIGKLTIYDTATCIGFEMNVFPTKVYLHAGAAIGAKALGIKGAIVSKKHFVDMCCAFNKLEPAQIEDFLCIYKKQLLGESNEIPIVCGNCC